MSFHPTSVTGSRTQEEPGGFQQGGRLFDSVRSAHGIRWLVCLILLAVSLGSGLGMRQPAPPDEPRFALAAKTMVETGQWLLPHRGIEFYAEKPPVFMWMQALTYELVGSWQVAFLLPSFLAALLTLGLTYDLGRRLWSRRIGQYAALALFTTLQFGLMSKRAQIDMTLVAMTTLSLWGLTLHLLRGPFLPGLVLAGFAAGLGTVTKGVGFLPLLAVIPWLLLRLQRHPLAAQVRSKHLGLLLPAFLLGTGVWLLPLGFHLWQSEDPALLAYTNELLFKQTGTRYVSAWHHVQPAWYYLQVVATLWLPGCLLLPWLIPAWGRRCIRGDARFVMLLGWSLLVLLFFTVSPGKREVYIFPVLPAVCLAAAPLLPALLARRAIRMTLLIYLSLLSVFALVLGAGMLLDAAWLQKPLAGRDLDGAAIVAIGTWLLLLGVAIAVVTALYRLRRLERALILSTALVWLIYGVGLMPTLDPYSSASRLMARVDEHLGPQGELGLVDWREQNYLQAVRPVMDFGFKQPTNIQWARARAWVGESPGSRFVLATEASLLHCSKPGAIQDMGQANRNRWLLVAGVNVPETCSGPSHPSEAIE